jgi:4-amino-4-deoxy-L-arabinose transferase-like glycosyltransferase
MSYVQETHVPATCGETVGRRAISLSTRAALAYLLLLAFLHGTLYAIFLPPWGLIDEAQHLHYIQYIAEEQSLPVAGELYLSDEIVFSLFATRRWETFHWTAPTTDDPQEMGLEGYSYEAYHPPLFYLLMTPFYLALPDDMLVKVYGLRMVVVMLSLITVWATYRTAQILLPQFPRLPFLASLLLIAIPERAIATSRINNDILLEVLAALFFVALTRAIVSGLTARRSLLLGLLLGLAVWVKISAVLLGIPLLLLLWMRRKQSVTRQIGWMALPAAPLGITLAIRNLYLYGDLTGFAAFEQLHRLAEVDTSFAGFVRTLVSLPNHFWLVWWKGSDVGQNALLTLFYLFMTVVVVVAWRRLAIVLWQKHQERNQGETKYNAHVTAALIYHVTILLYAAAVMNSYYQGMVPVIQGRFMLPALVPSVLLLVWGLWHDAHGEQMILAVVVVLWAMGLFSLFGNLVPYYYYWSEVVQGALPPQTLLSGELSFIYQRALLDKPAFVPPLLLVLPICYIAMLLFTLMVTLRAIRAPSHQPFNR